MIQYHAAPSEQTFQESASRWSVARASCGRDEPTALSAKPCANLIVHMESERDAFLPVEPDKEGVAVRMVTGTIEVIIAAILAYGVDVTRW